MTANIDDVASTLAEYERLAITSGARVQIDPPEFSTDGAAWSPVVAGIPAFARATVHRDDAPTTVYVAWSESRPNETALTEKGERWCDIWDAKPMQRFGSFALRTALRRAFREVIGNKVEPEEETGDPWAAPEPRDWTAELAETATPEDVRALHTAAKAARQVTPVLEAAFRKRLAEVVAAPAPAPELSPEEAAKHRAFFEQPGLAKNAAPNPTPDVVVPRPPAPDVPHLEDMTLPARPTSRPKSYKPGTIGDRIKNGGRR